MDCQVCNGHGDLTSSFSMDKHSQLKQEEHSMSISGSETEYVVCFRCEGRGCIEE
ncbi:hypothetical protein [Alkalihalobacterium chitinilyticum]|uniref:Molecular chaperone DnaJ n=1 Tax=Alkalihalobacterium chitinilyticum TaxID=2980103 RepID=A0ABT5VFK6_9BACI|nr:hypothetical protein [Alkalihalobacterium chitinilyticum]MDE5414245.1 hypothetical protein [Alkalihalobacterium chitinilyticum]